MQLQPFHPGLAPSPPFQPAAIAPKRSLEPSDDALPAVEQTLVQPKLERPAKLIKLSADGLLESLTKIKNEIEDLERKANGQIAFSHYQKAALNFCNVKEDLMEQMLPQLADQKVGLEQKREILLKLLDQIHPFPVSGQIAAKEEDYLQELKKYSDSLQLPEVADSIQRIMLPSLHFNRAYFFSMDVMEKVTQFEEGSRSEESDDDGNPQKLLPLIEQSIGNYEKARERFSNQKDIDACNRSIAIGFEKLGDLYFDLAKMVSEPDKKLDALHKALESYRMITVLQKKQVPEITLSILYVLYEIAATKKELKQPFTDALKQILQEVDSKLSDKKLIKKYYTLIFYALNAPLELYEIHKTEDYKKLATEKLELFISMSKSWPPEGMLEIDFWIRDAAQKLGIDYQSKIPVDMFQMASSSEENYQLKRAEQRLRGLELLLNSDLTKKYQCTLRPHQVASCQKLFELFKAGNKEGYFRLPTGAGKSILMLMVSLAIKMPTLIVVPNTLLMDQMIETIRTISPKIPVSRFDGLAKDNFSGGIMVTTYQSLDREFKKGFPRIPASKFGLVWADEAHRALSKNRLEAIKTLQKTACVLGLTATDAYNTKRRKGDASEASAVFGQLIHEETLENLILKKQLAATVNPLVHAPEVNFRGFLSQKKESSDYTDEELAAILNHRRFNEDICDIYQNACDPVTGEKLLGQQALVYCAGIEHAEAVAKVFNDRIPARNGYPIAAAVHSKIPIKRRRELIQLHKEGKIPVLVGDSVFAEGYDNPNDRIGFMVRPTKSNVFAQQRAGRLLRPNEGKQHALIFDWVYPGLDQILFREFVNNKAWVGVSPPATPLPERIAERYKIVWNTAEKPAAVEAAAPAAFSSSFLPPELPFQHTMAALPSEASVNKTLASDPNPNNFDLDDLLNFDTDEFWNQFTDQPPK